MKHIYVFFFFLDVNRDYSKLKARANCLGSITDVFLKNCTAYNARQWNPIPSASYTGFYIRRAWLLADSGIRKKCRDKTRSVTNQPLHTP